MRRLLDELRYDRDRQLLLRFYLSDDSKEEICADLGDRAGALPPGPVPRPRAAAGALGAGGEAAAVLRGGAENCRQDRRRSFTEANRGWGDATSMDHQSIDAGNIAERYVTGRLPPEEAARFEEHYLDCPSCCARVEAAERLQRGLRRLAEEAAVRRSRRSPRWSRSPRLALAAAALLAVALVPAWLELREVQRLRSDLARTKAEKGSADRLAAEGELQQTRRDLAAEAEKREALAREMAADRQPQTDLPVLALTPVRGGRRGPVRTLKLPAKPGWVALWVEPGDADYPAYRATLRTNEGAVVFQASPPRAQRPRRPARHRPLDLARPRRLPARPRRPPARPARRCRSAGSRCGSSEARSKDSKDDKDSRAVVFCPCCP